MKGRSRGFTLIEILVTIVIIGIVMSIGMLSLSLVGDDREIRKEAQRLVSLLQLAQDDALMQGREFGVEFMEGAYRFVEYDPASNQWAEPFLDDSLRTWQLPDNYEIELFMEDKQVRLEAEPMPMGDDDGQQGTRKAYAPHVLIFSSGDSSPFELYIRQLQGDQRVAIRGDLLGQLEFIPDDEIDR